MAWVYDSQSHQYRDGERVLSHDELISLRNSLADGMTSESGSIAKQLLDGALTLAEWAKAFAKLLTDGITAAFMLGRGGKSQMDNQAIATVDELIANQHSYAQSFTRDLAQGLIDGSITEDSADAVAARSAMYSGASVVAFDSGRAQDFMVDLPFFPSDGGTICSGNCRCSWSIADFADRIEAVWVTEQDHKVCEDCEARGNEYGPDTPFTQSKGA